MVLGFNYSQINNTTTATLRKISSQVRAFIFGINVSTSSVTSNLAKNYGDDCKARFNTRDLSSKIEEMDSVLALTRMEKCTRGHGRTGKSMVMV